MSYTHNEPKTANDWHLIAAALEVVSPDKEADQIRADELWIWALRNAQTLEREEGLTA